MGLSLAKKKRRSGIKAGFTGLGGLLRRPHIAVSASRIHLTPRELNIHSLYNA